jgi:alpha-glucan,water dikinase
MILILILSFVKVLITKDGGKINVHLATDYKIPATLHWALSRTTPGEWLVSVYC